MDKLQLLKERQKEIGCSDVGAIMGVSRWKSPFEVYFDKTEVNESSESSYWWNTLEEVVVREFSIRTGKKVRKIDNEFRYDIESMLYAFASKFLKGKELKKVLGLQVQIRHLDKNYLKI